MFLPQWSLLYNEQTELSLRPHPDTILDSEHMFTFKNQRVTIFYGILLVTNINLQSLCKGPLNRFRAERLGGKGSETVQLHT